MKILSFAGSLREKSLNKAALEHVAANLPAGVEMEIFDLKEIPLFNQDLESNLPEPVKKFKDAIKSADALLIASPEYNYSMTGVLKNAIDWGTRPYGNNSFDGKPAAVFGVSSGKIGTARGYYDVRKILQATNVFLVNYPEVLIGPAAESF